MTLPYLEPLTVREPGERVIPEPPRRGEPGGEPCALCTGEITTAVWSDEHFTLHPPVNGSLPGTVWLATKVHVDSFKDLPPEVAAAFGPLVGRIERAFQRRQDLVDDLVARRLQRVLAARLPAAAHVEIVGAGDRAGRMDRLLERL